MRTYLDASHRRSSDVLHGELEVDLLHLKFAVHRSEYIVLQGLSGMHTPFLRFVSRRAESPLEPEKRDQPPRSRDIAKRWTQEIRRGGAASCV
jgi:hypothetical protein